MHLLEGTYRQSVQIKTAEINKMSKHIVKTSIAKQRTEVQKVSSDSKTKFDGSNRYNFGCV